MADSVSSAGDDSEEFPMTGPCGKAELQFDEVRSPDDEVEDWDLRWWVIQRLWVSYVEKHETDR